MFIVLLKYVFIYVCYGKNIYFILLYLFCFNLFCYICSVLIYFYGKNIYLILVCYICSVLIYCYGKNIYFILLFVLF